MAETVKTPSVRRAAETTVSGSSTSGEAENYGRNLLEEGSELGAEMLAVVRDNAAAFYSEQRDRAANEIGALAELLHNSVKSMQRHDATVARFADEAASQVNGFSDWLRTRSWSELTGDVESLARRYPLSFLSTAAGLGFLAARMLTASAEPAPNDGMAGSSGMAGRGSTVTQGGGERDVVAGVAGGAAASHDAGLPGED
jgi:hypothetical protein